MSCWVSRGDGEDVMSDERGRPDSMTTKFRDILEKMPTERQERIRRRTEELLAALSLHEDERSRTREP